MNIEINVEHFLAWVKDREAAFGGAALPLIKKYLDQQMQEVPYSCPIINEVQTFMDQYFDSERVDKKLKQEMINKLEDVRRVNMRLRMLATRNSEKIFAE